MNKFFALALCTLFYIQFTEAQTVERSLSAGYISTAKLVKPYDADKWLVAGRGEPEPGAYFQDTLFVTVIGQDGKIYLRKNLTLPFEELHFFHDILALPDGGILACFESTLCDVGGYKINLQRLDNQGNLIWERAGGFVFCESRLPEKWFFAQDGNLLGAGYDQIWKLDINTGDVFWQAELEGVNNGDISPYEFALIQGTEDFFALGDPDFQVWKQSGNSADPVYVMEGSLALDGYRRSLSADPFGKFYCWQVFPEDKIERIGLDLQLETLPIPLIDFGSIGIAVSQQGLYLTESSSGTNRIQRFDLNGENPINLHSDPNSLNPLSISVNNGLVAVVGEDGSGTTNWSSYNQTWSGAWFRAFSEAAPAILAEKPDIAVTEIQQLDLIDTASQPAFPFGSLYNLTGGNFKVRVTNLGTVSIDRVGINVSFGFNNYYDICSNRPAKQIQFEQINLASGESAWLNFGNIQAMGQAEIPSEICFWTSSPNEQPDAVHENDRSCHAASYIVATKDPKIAKIAFIPNPADDFTALTLSEMIEGEPWQIFDAAGRIVSSGVCTAGKILRLGTAQLSNGFYLLHLKNRVGKLVVQH